MGLNRQGKGATVFLSLIFPLTILLTAQPPQELQTWGILFTGGYKGRMQGCGYCPGSSVGGLSRRESAIRRLDHHIPWIGLDAGGFLDLDVEGGRERSRCAIRGLVRQGHRIFGVTPRDLFYGVEFLQKAFSSAGGRLVSANIIHPQTGIPLFPIWDTLMVGNAQWAITSVSLPPVGSQGGSSWIVGEPLLALKTVQDNRPKDAQFIVLLTDAEESTLREWGDVLSAFHLIITSSRYVYSASPFKLGSTWVVRPQIEGRALDGIILSSEGYQVTLIQSFSYPLGSSYPPDETMERFLERCLQGEE